MSYYDTILHKSPPNTASLTFVFLELAKLRADYPQLTVKYFYAETTRTYFFLFQPAKLIHDNAFLKKLTDIMLQFDELFPNEGLAISEKIKLSFTNDLIEILTPSGFQLPSTVLALIAKSHQAKFTSNLKSYKNDETTVKIVAEPKSQYKKTNSSKNK